jgi:Kef-type K+ transport system membrane component KefB
MITDLGIVGSAGIMIVVAAMMMLITRRLRIPGIVTYIVAGLLLGPVGFDLLALQPAHEATATWPSPLSPSWVLCCCSFWSGWS